MKPLSKRPPRTSGTPSKDRNRISIIFAPPAFRTISGIRHTSGYASAYAPIPGAVLVSAAWRTPFGSNASATIETPGSAGTSGGTAVVRLNRHLHLNGFGAIGSGEHSRERGN